MFLFKTTKTIFKKENIYRIYKIENVIRLIELVFTYFTNSKSDY